MQRNVTDTHRGLAGYHKWLSKRNWEFETHFGIRWSDYVITPGYKKSLYFPLAPVVLGLKGSDTLESGMA